MLVVLFSGRFSINGKIAELFYKGGGAGAHMCQGVTLRTLVRKLFIPINRFSESHNEGVHKAVQETADHAEGEGQNPQQQADR